MSSARGVGCVLVCLALGAGLGACRKGGSQAIDLTGTAGSAAPGKPEPAEEPSERVLKALLLKQYEQINGAGGMPVTVTATGRSVVLKPRLHEAHKSSCRKLPANTGGGYECVMDVMITLMERDRTPGKSAERLYVHWDGDAGEWASGTPARQRK